MFRGSARKIEIGHAKLLSALFNVIEKKRREGRGGYSERGGRERETGKLNRII